MVYHGQPKRERSKLGREVTQEDHAYVRQLSLLGVGVRDLGALLGERFALGKPMSRLMLYYHFRSDITPQQRGRKPMADMPTKEGNGN